MDPTTPLPQVVLSYYTGGAHCCRRATIWTQSGANAWTPVNIDGIDENGLAFDFNRVGDVDVIVASDIGFAYVFGCYSCSYPPTKLLALKGTSLRDVTRVAAYRGVLREQLKEMETRAEFKPDDTADGYGFLAGWTAQKLLLGEPLANAWREMLAHYSAAIDNYSSCNACRVCLDGQDTCQDAQKRPVDFPLALAIFLRNKGYVTAAQLKAAGVDTDVRNARWYLYDWAKFKCESAAAIAESSGDSAAVSPAAFAEAHHGAYWYKDMHIYRDINNSIESVAFSVTSDGKEQKIYYFPNLARCAEFESTMQQNGYAPKSDEMQ
jgi:hypothetical protein